MALAGGINTDKGRIEAAAWENRVKKIKKFREHSSRGEF